MIHSTVQSLRVSAVARLRRHERVFGRNSIPVLAFKKAQELAISIGNGTMKYTGASFAVHAFKAAKTKYNAHVVAPTPGTLYKRLAFTAVSMLSITIVLGGTLDVSYAAYGTEEYMNQVSQEGTLVTDSDGYFTKANPQTSTSRIDRTFKDVATYSVESGDNLSLVAQRFHLKSETLIWENGLTLASVLKVGQKLSIPPANGVSHRVSSGQSVEKIAALYKVDAQKIVAMNSIQHGTLTQGQVIFVPDAKPLPDVRLRTNAKTVARSTGRDAPSRNAERTKLEGSDSTPVAGKFLIFPTIGSLTQGFRSGHYAYDIGNRSKPPIWAAASGTVVVATQGVWAGGYGNHVVIDHRNGVKTLYGHMDHILVKDGDYVSQGEVIGQMGNTGNVRGATGIHLHFEVIDHGVKKAPGRYY